ncbi:MAG: glycosyltransferase [Saprospiraceae bacterium]|nr:glycosyltransferase [Saprospiraceae bacterium]
MKHRLLKFDIIHPGTYLERKKSEWNDLRRLSREEYLDRLIALRSNYSDYYTHHLQQQGDWEAEEFFLLDPTFIDKTAEFLWKRKLSPSGIWRLLRKATLPFDVILDRNRWAAAARHLEHLRWRHLVIDAYIRYWKPDVIFVRSQPVPSFFWQKYRKDTLLVSRLSARLPLHWHPNHWDLIYTDHPDFKTFFELHGVPTILNDQGFDHRIIDELQQLPKKYELSFVGGMGTENFLRRTLFFNEIAKRTNFIWWGYWWKYGDDGRRFSDFPALVDSFQGPTSGLEMYQIYKDSMINLNDYVDTADGRGFNQRMFEVMGAGGFLLTRQAPNFEKDFPPDIFITYTGPEDCIDKISYFLNHEKEREEIAAAGQQFVIERYDYRRITREFGEDLKSLLKSRRLK